MRDSISRVLRHIVTCAAALTAGAAWSADDGAVWVLIDGASATLTVYQDHRPKRRYADIAIGRGGLVDSRMRGDGTTPKGWFRVSWSNPDSRFRHFYGLDFPNMDHADAAYRDGVIERHHWLAIKRALERGLPPPAGTPLGGRIGIHGLGTASRDIHARFNWTQGCVAVSNDQIDELAHWLKPGTPVLIR